MDFWNDLDMVKNIRIAFMIGGIFCTVFSLVFHIRTNTLTDKNAKKEKIRIEIDRELDKANTDYVSMKSGDLDGMTNLINKFKESPHEKVKNEAKKYLDLANDYFFKEVFYVQSEIPDWGNLALQDERSLNHYKERLLGGATTINERASILRTVNQSFGVDFKLYEIEAVKLWLNNNEHLKLVEEAKQKIVNENPKKQKPKTTTHAHTIRTSLRKQPNQTTR